MTAIKAATVTAPSVGSTIHFGSNGYGSVASALVSSGSIIVTFRVLIYDYIGDSNTIQIEKGTEVNLGSSYTLVTDSELALLNTHLAIKNMYYNKSKGLVYYRLGSRLPAGTTYYYLNDQFVMTSAVEDGLATGIHKNRFAKGNYVTDTYNTTYGSAIASNMSKSMIDALCGKEMNTGNYWE